MTTKTATKPPGEQAIRALFERHACPVPFHAVRTRFLGGIASPELAVSPLQIVKGLWGGSLPVFDGMDEVNDLLGALVQGLWNDLTRHQKRSQPFRLSRVSMEPTVENLAQFGQVRLQEVDGFIEGLFNGEDALDLPERAHKAVGQLGELRAMMAGICNLVSADPYAADRTALDATFKGLRELNRIMESEIHEAVLSCTRARRQMVGGIVTERPTMH